MRMYVLSNTIAGFSTAKTIVEIGCVTNKLIKIHRIKVTQSTSETDDSTRLEWGLYTASGTGSDVKSLVARKDPGDTAFAGTAEDNHSADISTGEVIDGKEGISLLAGFEKIFLPDERMTIPGGSFFGLQNKIAFTAVDLEYEIAFQEEG